MPAVKDIKSKEYNYRKKCVDKAEFYLAIERGDVNFFIETYFPSEFLTCALHINTRRNALHLAVQFQHEQLVLYFLEQKEFIKLNAEDFNKNKALDIAKRRKNQKITQALIDALDGEHALGFKPYPHYVFYSATARQAEKKSSEGRANEDQFVPQLTEHVSYAEVIMAAERTSEMLRKMSQEQTVKSVPSNFSHPAAESDANKEQVSDEEEKANLSEQQMLEARALRLQRNKTLGSPLSPLAQYFGSFGSSPQKDKGPLAEFFKSRDKKVSGNDSDDESVEEIIEKLRERDGVVEDNHLKAGPQTLKVF